MYMRLRETTLLLLALWLQLCAAQTPEQTHYCSACIAAGGAWFTGENSSLGSPTYAHDSQVRPTARFPSPRRAYACLRSMLALMCLCETPPPRPSPRHSKYIHNLFATQSARDTTAGCRRPMLSSGGAAQRLHLHVQIPRHRLPNSHRPWHCCPQHHVRLVE